MKEETKEGRNERTKEAFIAKNGQKDKFTLFMKRIISNDTLYNTIDCFNNLTSSYCKHKVITRTRSGVKVDVFDHKT